MRGGKLKGLVASALVLAGLTLASGRAQAAVNLLQNGNFNAPAAGNVPDYWNPWAWGTGWANYENKSGVSYDGSYYVVCGGMNLWSGGGGFNQIVPGNAGVTYTLSVLSGADAWWLPYGEMRLFFLDAGGATLANPVQSTVDPAVYGQNQNIPHPWAPYTLTATAPAGTTQVKVEFCDPSGQGSVWFENAELTASVVYPTIANICPDGSTLMQATNGFTFTASSTTTPINASGIQVTVNGVDVSASLSISGSSLSKSVLYSGILSNKAYTVNIQVADANGILSTKSLRFDTFSPSYYTWEGEDWDINGGQFYDNPQTNAYFGLTTGLPEVDYHEVSTGTNQWTTWTYRPWVDGNPPLPQTEVTTDLKRAQYASTNDYDISYYDAGEWLNYTRTFPSGLFNVWARMSSPGVATMNLSQVTSGRGTASQTTVSLGNFALDGGLGWGAYCWVPLTDASGNMVKVNLGGVSTLRVTAGGNANLQFLMLVPADTSAPTITGLYPDGTVQFQATNKLSFTANSAVGINANSIQVTLNVTNVAVHFTTNLTSANGLTVGGTATARTVSYAGLIPNATYTAVIAVTDQNNNTVTIRPRFDTYNPVLTWEAEDWDYNSGRYIDNPAVDAYAGLAGYAGVDFYFTNTSDTLPRPYRPASDQPAAGLVQETPRAQYVAANTNDYAVGYFTVSEWLNYTRSFPAGTYNLYGRFSAGGGTSYLSLGLVNGGVTSPLGTFTVADTGGWGTYRFTPLRDQFGNVAQVTLNGPTTLKVQHTSGADANINFFMLLPADTSLLTITQVTPIGPMQSTNKLQFVTSSTAGIATSNIVVTLNGVKSTSVTCTGSATAWNVSAVLAPNTIYSATITVTDNKGQVATTTASFDTFSLDSYTWEAEDFDHDNGQFFDNPQVGSYMGYGGVAGVDYHKEGTGGSGTAAYRTGDVATEACSDSLDTLRPAYASGYNGDYDVGYTSTGDWWNYTRTYPAGQFNVYLRAARGSGGTATMGLQQVTSGQTTSSQTTVGLGSFSIPATSGWQNYAWVPLKDSNGNLAVVSLNGLATLRLTDGGANLNFLALVPAVALKAAPSAGNLNLSFNTQTGFNYTVVYKSNLSDSTWTELTTVAGDGSLKTVSPAMNDGAGRRFYRLLVH